MSMTADHAGFRSRSLSGAARDWITNLPPGTWFHTTSVPGPRHVVRLVLSRLLAAETPIIGRAARGIYWRQPPPASTRYAKPPLLTHSADAVLAPAGSGYAAFSALNRIGWGTQVPVRTCIAVPYRNLTPPTLPAGGPAVAFVERANRRRRSLNWNEATLLEAAKAAGAADFPSWDHALWCLLDANGWMQRGHPIRRDDLLWAAEAEPASYQWPAGQGHRSFDSIIHRLGNDLPPSVLTSAPPALPDPHPRVAYPIQ